MKKILLLFFIFSFCACSSSLSVPAWQNKAGGYLEDYKINFLSGKEDATEPHFGKAIREISSGNDLNLLSTAYLIKYALHTACLEYFDPSDFARISRLEPNPANLAYVHFLKGNFTAVDRKLLPSQYAGVLKAALSNDVTLGSREISAIDDPLSQLVACGVWIRYLPGNDAIFQTAIDTASFNGWRRPLFAYLEKLHAFYLKNGDAPKAEAIKLRLELLKKK